MNLIYFTFGVWLALLFPSTALVTYYFPQESNLKIWLAAALFSLLATSMFVGMRIAIHYF